MARESHTGDSLQHLPKSLYPLLRQVAGLCPSVIVANCYLWKRDDPVVHFGALCSDGVEMLLAPTSEHRSDPRLLETARFREDEDVPHAPYLCARCQVHADLAMRAAFEAPLAHVTCADGLLAVVYTGFDEEMATAFAALEREGLVDPASGSMRLTPPGLAT